MNILLINNVASFHSTLATSLNKLEQVNATYITTSRHPYVTDNEFGVYIPLYVPKSKPFSFLIHKLTYKRRIKKLIREADVIYYLWDSLLEEEDLAFARSLGKPIFIEWVGSDIRDPEKLRKINPWFDDTFDKGYEYKNLESSGRKNTVQVKFSNYGAKVLSAPEMKLYVREDLFASPTTLFQRINLEHFTPAFPDVSNKRPKIVHSPSAPIAKGTPYIEQVIAELAESYDFDFVYLTGMSRNEVLNEIRTADIFLDQIVIGGYGMASCEAMAFGKPAMCYLLPELFELGLPADCPIVNTNPENLKENLIRLLSDPHLRNETGIKSRKYAETYHDSDRIAAALLPVFKQAVV
ncbi:glycosyltransferase [Fluviicola sp.]|uniref:glycosyltransferase n=1 Tax=Fluviicola sp. TaxID=1917219 RepID=UPI0031D5AE1F